MYYLVVFVVGILLMFLVDKTLKKVRGECLKDSVKNNFNIIKMIGISFAFVSIVMACTLFLVRWGFMSNNSGEFSIKLLPFILYTIIFVPLVEEYIFRYLPYKIINKKKFNVLIMIVSSIVFTFFHKAEDFEYILYFGMGIALSLIYLKNDNLIYSIASHALYNTLVLVNYFTGWGNPYLFLLIFVISLIVTKKATKKVKQIKN